jgi:hypothetical protein
MEFVSNPVKKGIVQHSLSMHLMLVFDGANLGGSVFWIIGKHY